jgi:hypothetical protein
MGWLPSVVVPALSRVARLYTLHWRGMAVALQVDQTCHAAATSDEQISYLQ